MRIIKPAETDEYQEFLVSEQRYAFIPDNLITNLFPQGIQDANILEFNCGLGYNTFKIANYLTKKKNVQLYCCDFIEDILDLVWQRKVLYDVNNVTAFYLADQSRIYFPRWIPSMDIVLLNMSLSITDSPKDFLQFLPRVLTKTAQIHILDWMPQKENPLLNQLYPHDVRISPQTVKTLLEENQYRIIKTIVKDHFFFVYTCVYEGEQKSHQYEIDELALESEQDYN